ncbi:trp operon leader peptide [Enterobacter bugandensis]|nr:trp operon leader peptide [Enterobacter bugandensis]HDV8261243.1 trp operon leader peptide [Enterobacter hormaechei]
MTAHFALHGWWRPS